MKANSIRPVVSLLLAFLTQAVALHAATPTGPFPPTDWPPTRDPAKVVHFITVGDALTPPSGTWTPDLSILTGGDQVTEDITIGGFQGKKVTGSFLNIADTAFTAWADSDFIDILVQAYGDAALFDAKGAPRNFNFLIGTLPEVTAPAGGQVAVEAKNKKWNWILFRIPNSTRPSDGSRRIGSIPANAQGATTAGGVNGGTIRAETVPNLIVRTVAFGAEGAFGTPEDINLFASSDACEPEPVTNLVGIDISAGVTNKIRILNDGDQTVTLVTGVGPAGDLRRAVKPDGTFLNFGILDSYLGRPCNEPHAMKICVEFFDDPAFAGNDVHFGPEAYATDETTGTAVLPASARPALLGTGKWIRRSWLVPAVDLRGVNAGGLTAGPRLASENGSVAVSSFQLAVIRGGTHPLAGQDALADCYADPAICTDAYGNFAELDLGKEVRNGIDVGTSGGDQQMIVAEAGPAKDRRQAVRPAFDDGTGGFSHQYLNFAITGEALGPSSQPPAVLAIVATYYDDPALSGKTMRPEVYATDRNGTAALGFTAGTVAIPLEGTDTWRDAYWEIPDVKFNGVNQGPQAAARFAFTDKIFITRLRYAIIRPCGANAGKNLLASYKPRTDISLAVSRSPDGRVRIAWPADATGFVLQATPALGGAWTAVPDAPVVDGNQLAVLVTADAARFYRLAN